MAKIKGSKKAHKIKLVCLLRSPQIMHDTVPPVLREWPTRCRSYNYFSFSVFNSNELVPNSEFSFHAMPFNSYPYYKLLNNDSTNYAFTVRGWLAKNTLFSNANSCTISNQVRHKKNSSSREKRMYRSIDGGFACAIALSLFIYVL